MSARSWILTLGLAAGLGLPAVALADDVVVPPLVPRGATSVRDVANVSQLLASELDFMRDVETVKALPKVPAGFGVGCLDNSGCLKTIGQAEGGTHVLAGALTVTDAKVKLDLVYFSVQTGRFVRRQSFDVQNTPESIADTMGDIAKEMVTGQAPGDDAVADDDIDLLDFDEDFEVDFDKDDFAEAQAADAVRKREQAEAAARREAEERARREEQARREAEERRRAEEEARRRAEEEARRRAEEEARRQAEAEARRREAEEERRRAEAAAAERRRVEEQRRAEALRREEELRREQLRRDEQARSASVEPDPPEEEFDPNAISFGSAAILVEEPDGGPVAIETEPTPTRDYYEDEEPDILDFEDEEPDEPLIADLDDEPRRDKPVRDKPVREKKTKPARQKSSGGFDDTPTTVGIAVRGGYSPYYRLGFVTVGGELSVAAGDTGLNVLFGVQTYAVQRTIPEDFRELAGASSEWNTIFPVNAGLVYKVPLASGRVKPYGGGDLMLARYYKDESSGKSSMAFGVRARGGVEVMIVRNVGVNADLALGGWGGGDWEIIEEGVKNAGLLPQISAGTVIAF